MTRPMRIVSSKYVLPALLHLEQDVVDVGHAEAEVAHQVLLVDRQLTLDFVERREVLLEERRADRATTAA